MGGGWGVLKTALSIWMGKPCCAVLTSLLIRRINALLVDISVRWEKGQLRVIIQDYYGAMRLFSRTPLSAVGAK